MTSGKKPVNIFKFYRGDSPKEIFNWRLWLAVASFSLMGAARGIDEGLISGVLSSNSFQKLIGLDGLGSNEAANIKGNIIAMVNIGSVGGTILASFTCDRIGRVWATRVLCLLWMTGIAIFLASNGHLGAVYAGRFIAGLGIGQTTAVAPVYLAEISPASIRGLCTCFFTGAVYLGIVLAYFENYGSAKNMPDGLTRWVLPTSLHLIFATIILVLSFLTYESPRYLVKRGKHEEARHNLCHIRNLPQDDPYIVDELNAIDLSLIAERDATSGIGVLGLLKEMFLVPGNLYRIYIRLAGQLLSQWSGGPSVTVYAVNFFGLLGITGQEQSLFSTAIFGLVKLTSALICALFLVDIIGRKRSLLIGITLQSISMLYIAAYLTAVPGITDKNFQATDQQGRAGTGAIAMIYISGIGWALGWNSMQYLLTAELYPLRIRTISTSLVMCTHFVNSYGNSRAIPNMLLSPSKGGISPAGTFWMFAAITLLGGFWVFFTVPETAGQSLEDMDSLFSLPWYKIGLHGRAVADAEQPQEELDKKE